jgi:hypothetical protein
MCALRYGAIVSTPATQFRILAVVPSYRRGEIARQLEPLNAQPLIVCRSTEAATEIREGDVFQVALLPACLSDEASFQLWSGVLELGGYDVIVEPFSDEELCEAVLRAAQSFEEQTPNGSLQE